MEMGSYLELDLKKTGEYYHGSENIARLNTGRSGIYHSLKILRCNIIYLPYYLCPDVKLFLHRKSISIRFYNISEDFEPLIDINPADSAILIVNYFGLVTNDKLDQLRQRYRNVIIDNCAGFFMKSFPDCFNIYSCRKFFGVPDGCYVIGPGAHKSIDEYPQDHSSETSLFLLRRIESGCSEAYNDRMKNEDRLNNSDVLRMSGLTEALMNSLDYSYFIKKRKSNFSYAVELYTEYNLLKSEFFSGKSLPLFYPLLIRDKVLVDKLKIHGVYTGRRWVSVLDEVRKNSFEAYLSRYMVPIPVDQRYGKEEMDWCYDIFTKVMRT